MFEFEESNKQEFILIDYEKLCIWYSVVWDYLRYNTYKTFKWNVVIEQRVFRDCSHKSYRWSRPLYAKLPATWLIERVTVNLVKGKGGSSEMILGYIELAGRIRSVNTEPFESKWIRAANAFSCFIHAGSMCCCFYHYSNPWFYQFLR